MESLRGKLISTATHTWLFPLVELLQHHAYRKHADTCRCMNRRRRSYLNEGMRTWSRTGFSGPGSSTVVDWSRANLYTYHIVKGRDAGNTHVPESWLRIRGREVHIVEGQRVRKRGGRCFVLVVAVAWVFWTFLVLICQAALET